MDNKPITFRPTPDAQTALKALLELYQKEFPTLSQSDVINKAILELAHKVEQEKQK